MSILENIICYNKDLRSEILSSISARDKNRLLSTNKKMYKIKQKIFFNFEVTLTEQLYKLSYYDSFTCVRLKIKGTMKLPKNITSLTFDDKFNEQIYSDTIPSTVTYLSLGNKSIIYPGYIPNSVKTLWIDLDQKFIPGMIPNSVIKLYFWDKCSMVEGSIPESVKEIIFYYCFDQLILPGLIPKSVKRLHVHNIKNLTYDSIPASVKKLYVNNVKPEYIPNSVTHLTLGYSFKQKIIRGLIPNSVTHLIFNHNYNEEIEPNTLSDTITHLTLGDKYDKHIKCFPESLTSLTLGEKYFHKIDSNILTLHLNMPSVPANYIPKSVTKLILGPNVTHLDDNAIPSNISHLEVKSPKINIFEFTSNVSDNLKVFKIHSETKIPKFFGP